MLVKRVDRVLKAQKVGKSRLLLLIQSNPPNDEIYIFVKIMNQILQPQKIVIFLESKCCQNYGQCPEKVKGGLSGG